MIVYFLYSITLHSTAVMIFVTKTAFVLDTGKFKALQITFKLAAVSFISCNNMHNIKQGEQEQHIISI